MDHKKILDKLKKIDWISWGLIVLLVIGIIYGVYYWSSISGKNDLTNPKMEILYNRHLT